MQSPSFKGNGVVQEMRMFSGGLCLKPCLHTCDGSLLMLKCGRAISEGMVNLQPLCTLTLHWPCFSWMLYYLANDTASGLIKMPAVNRGFFGALSQAAQSSLSVPVVLFKTAVWARNSSPSLQMLGHSAPADFCYLWLLLNFFKILIILQVELKPNARTTYYLFLYYK